MQTKNMNQFKPLIIVLIIACVLSAGCLGYNPEDKIYADYMPLGYYYFVDDEDRSFYETLWAENMSEYINIFNSPRDWVEYIQHMKYIDDGHNGIDEHFSTISETLSKNGGDCEDRAILMARVLYEYGYDTCVIVTKNHVLAGINKKQFNNDVYKVQPLTHDSYSSLYNLKNLFKDYIIIECTAPYPIGYYDEKVLDYEKIYYLEHSSN